MIKKTKRVFSLILFICFVICFAIPMNTFADDSDKKVVRVGWYESTYCYKDKFGRRSGIAYEYQERIAAHTGWTYEYVEDSWPNLLQMLKDGQIDLLSDVSYTEERAEQMLFPSLAMGAESYYIYIDADNNAADPDDLSSFNGKRIGVNKNSVQAELLRTWIKKNALTPEIIEVTDDEGYFMKTLSDGKLDAVVTLDSFGSHDRVIPVCKIGSSDYFFAVSKSRSDLINELNTAMTIIKDEDPYFNQRMFDSYVHLTKTNAFLSQSQENWLLQHGTIRVGYRENYLPFCAKDKESGEVSGALKVYLVHASNCLKNAEVRFEAVPFYTIREAFDAMKNGEIDCVFPVNLSTYDGEQLGIITVNPIMQTEVYAVVKRGRERDYSVSNALTVAVNNGNINYDTFLKDTYPEWEQKSFDSVEECFSAVTSGKADCMRVSSYRINGMSGLLEKYDLISIPTGETVKYAFAVNRDEHEMYSILNKISNLTKAEDMETALFSHMNYERQVSLMQILKDNWLFVVTGVTVVFAVIIFLLMQKLKSERKINE